jgi:small GTP-binding protein
MITQKICMLGSFSVGKTSLVRRFVERIFFDKYHTTIGVKVDKKTVPVNNTSVELALWDIYGEDDYQKVKMMYLRGMHGYLLVVDGTRRQTLDVALALNDKVTQTIRDVPFVLLLNKCDLADQWEIDPDTDKTYAAKGWQVLRTSAKTGENVDEAFSQLSLVMLAKMNSPSSPGESRST